MPSVDVIASGIISDQRAEPEPQVLARDDLVDGELMLPARSHQKKIAKWSEM